MRTRVLTDITGLNVYVCVWDGICACRPNQLQDTCDMTPQKLERKVVMQANVLVEKFKDCGMGEGFQQT